MWLDWPQSHRYQPRWRRTNKARCLCDSWPWCFNGTVFFTESTFMVYASIPCSSHPSWSGLALHMVHWLAMPIALATNCKDNSSFALLIFHCNCSNCWLECQWFRYWLELNIILLIQYNRPRKQLKYRVKLTGAARRRKRVMWIGANSMGACVCEREGETETTDGKWKIDTDCSRQKEYLHKTQCASKQL